MPKALKILATGLALTMGLSTFNMASAADIEVVFSDRLARNMGQLNDIEQNREKYFRETYDDVASNRGRSERFFDVARHGNVPWTGETLIPNLSDYTVENLFVVMAEETLKRAGMDNLEGTVRFTIRQMKVANHSLNFLRSTDSYVVGTVEHIGRNGQVLASTKVSANLVIDVSVDNNYEGDDFPFFSTDAAKRVGPTLSRFIQKGLERLFDGREFNGPIIIG